MMCLSCVACGSCVVPSMIGTLGPYTSASSKPTLWPSFTNASARFTATVVFPTPPFPLATATRFFTPGIGWRSGCCWGAGPGGIGFLCSRTGILACPLFNQARLNFCSRLQQGQDRQECLSHSCAVAFLVLLPRAARARIVASNFCANLHGFRRFRLCRAGLILQIFLLALLAAFDFPCDGGQMLRLAGPRGRAGGNGISARTRRLLRRRSLWRASRRRLLTLLNLDVVEITHSFVVNARHHVFEKDERFLLKFNERIFLPVAAQANALFQVVERQQVVFPLRVDHVEDDAAFEPAHQVRAKLRLFFFVAFLDRFRRGVGKLLVV